MGTYTKRGLHFHIHVENQLMPALLSVLRVDDTAAAAAAPDDTSTDSSNQAPPLATGGMDWGVVAVYSCAASCAKGTKEWAVVQPPVGEEN